MSARLLLVEDEGDIAMVISDLLRAEGHLIDWARTGQEGLQRATADTYDLLILDVMLPGISGMDICHRVREQGFDGAILMLTARGEIPDRVLGLQRGADDYVVKPFAPEELAARVSALLRRVRKDNLTPVMRVEFGSCTADFANHEFFREGQPLNLTTKEAGLLRLLINHRGQPVSRERILHEVWTEQPHITLRTVDVHIAWLRQKLEVKPEAPQHILTVRGQGSRFEL
jgi:two-component system, OmpR family, alkaline phosphatase synthesis response regulator PhoP